VSGMTRKYKGIEWIKKSIKIANGKGYLDRLHNIYPVEPIEREVPSEILKIIKKAYESRDPFQLVKTLLEVKIERFPIDHPFIPFLKMNKIAIEKNPQTVKKIGETLFSMGLNQIIHGIKRPKAASRRMGQMFHNWLLQLGYPVLEEDQFETYQDIAILNGSEKTLMKFANRRLRCKLNKGIDLVVKVSNIYIIGEAKLLTDIGGEQYTRLKEALDFAEKKEGDAIRVAILDGVVWIPAKNKMHKAVIETKSIALTALLLKEFIESLK
jgi:hypothetical protein